MRIVVLAGGIGGARFLRGLRKVVADGTENGLDATTITVVGNTGDDITLFGLRVCPDLDTVMYTLGDGINTTNGWGRADETFTIREELAAHGQESLWFTLGDRDFANHIMRTEMLNRGLPLSAVTESLCQRWDLGLRLLPMTDDPVETHVVVNDEGTERDLHFQEWWVRHRAALPARAIYGAGAESAAPAPGVLEALEEADFVLLPPSNPVVSVGTILSVPGLREAVAAKTVVGVSPIIGAAPVRGMADACLAAIDVETSARAVAEHYGPDLLDGWLVDTVDADVAASGIKGTQVRARPLYMTDDDATADIARDAIVMAQEIVGDAQ